MKQTTTGKSISGFSEKVKMRMLFFAFLFLSFTNTFATHFRYGIVTATRLSETATNVTYRLNVSMAWRLTAAPGNAIFNISGGNSGSVNVTLSNVTDPSGSWTNSSGTANVTLNKTVALTKIEYTSCCKISTLANNRDTNWDVYTIISTGAPGGSPVSTLPAIINMPINAAAATYTIPASDPDAGSTLTYGVPSFTGALAGQSNPAGFSVNSTTGQITFNTIGKVLGSQYNAMVTVTDNNGNQIMLDFMINMVGPSNPPAFDYTVTPINGAIFNVIAGQNISFAIKATDSDAGSTVSFSVSGLPVYITTSNFSSAALPATGNPAQTTFSWTPAAAQIGSTVVLNFIATDNVGVQSSTSITIRIAAEPAPVFIAPTPAQNSIRQIVTGSLFTDIIRAESSLGSNVSIAFATGVPAGASLSPVVPTAGANPGETTLNWTPAPSDFGLKTLSFQATISSTPTIFSTRDYQLIVNTPPAFTSTAGTSVLVGQPYNYNVTVSDLDIPYGDEIDIVGTTIPSWLTLVSTGNGTATLSGTPSIANIGVHHVELEGEDIYHHGNPSHVHQHFHIKVIEPAPVAICKNITVQLDNNGSVTIAASDVDNGSHSALGISSMAISKSSFDCSNIGANTVTLTVTNVNGNVATCTSTVTVADNIAPVAVCKNITVSLDANGKVTVSPAQVNNGSSDACGIATIGLNCPNTATGNLIQNGDFSSGTTGWNSVNVHSTAGWSSTGGNPGSYFILNDIGLLSTDPTISQTLSGLTVGTTYTVTGNFKNVYACCGNPSAPSFGVFIDGNLIHQASNPGTSWTNFTTQFTATNSVHTISFAAERNGDDTDYGIDNISIIAPASTSGCDNSVSFNCSNVGANTVKLTVTDVNGNASTCTSTVTVKDNIAPVAVCKNITVQLNATGTASIVAADVNNGSSDACGIASIAINKSTFNCSNVGANTVTLTVKDVNENASTCTSTVTVEDKVAPIAVCKNITVQLDATGTASIVAADVNNGSSDACGIPSLTINKSTFDCSNLGANTVTLTVTDVNGNVSTCTSIVTVIDNQLPVIIGVPADATVSCDNITSPGSVSVSDNCSTNLSFYSTPGIRTKLVHNWKAENNFIDIVGGANGTPSGAVSFGSGILGSNSFAFNGSTGYISTGIAGSVSGTGNFSVSAWVKTTSNASMVVIQQRDAGFVGEYIFKIGGNHNNSDLRPGKVYLLAYGSGSPVVDVFSSISVNDGKWHHIITEKDGSNVRIYIDGTLNASGSTAVAVSFDGTISTSIGRDVRDNNSNFNGLIDDIKVWSATACPSNYEFDRVWQATDVAGNQSAAVQHVTVQDNEAPVLACPSDILVNNTTGQCGANVSFEAIAKDNCSTFIISYDKAPGSFFALGTTTVNITATDACGNISHCNFNVTVIDSEIPTIAGLSNISVSNDLGVCGATVNYIAPVGIDNCAGATTAQIAGLPSGSVFPIGTTTNTFEVTDAAGNIASTSFDVIVTDTENPIIICPTNISVQAQRNDCSPIVNWRTPVASDNCTYTVTSNYQSGNRFPVGTTTVIYTVVDASGNSVSCSFNITVTPDPLLVSVSAKTYIGGNNVSCKGKSDGEATVVVEGGCLPYSYLWSNNQTGSTATGLVAGTYTVIITDANGTTISSVITLTEPAQLIVNAGNNQTVYYGYNPSACATLNGSATGGILAYTYAWSNGASATSTTVCPSVTTSYNLTVTDVNGCVANDVATVCVIDVRCDKGGKAIVYYEGGKVLVCHIPSGDVTKREVICISPDAVAAHLAHGDQLGICGVNTSCVEDVRETVEENHEEITISNEMKVLAFPNPFNSTTTISFNSTQDERITVKVYNINGDLVADLFDEDVKAGEIRRDVIFNGNQLSSGMYFAKVSTSSGKVIVRKLMLNK